VPYEPVVGVEPDPRDPLHHPMPAGISWTTTNLAEAVPGVPTPLTWTFADEGFNLGTPWVDMGAFPKRTLRWPLPIEEKTVAIFYGHVCMNLAVLARMARAVPPPSNIDGFHEQYFGPRQGPRPSPVWRRYPIVLAKLPPKVLRAQARTAAIRDETRAWWAAAVREQEGLDLESAVVLLVDARTRFSRIMRAHGLNTFVSAGLFEQIEQLAQSAGMGERTLALVGGHGGVAEIAVADDLWLLAHGELTLETFLGRHGYHGHDEGELASPSWREEPSAIDALVSGYGGLANERRPRSAEERRSRQRAEHEAELLASLSPLRRTSARRLLTFARRYMPLREVGKMAFLQATDVARLAARRIGAELTDRGVIGRPEDVFLLTYDELKGDPSALRNALGLVELRQARRDLYRTLELPRTWTGEPEVRRTDGGGNVEAKSGGARGVRIEAIPASGGVVEGTVRRMLDPTSDGPLEDGEILVCHITDPSWVSHMVLARALVIDVGGVLSHGAIVARELDIPCVIGTGDGTRRLRTGDVVRVDGDRGVVELIDPDPAPAREATAPGPTLGVSEGERT
jgi:phosphohistidine swiveling domain-containing protein